MAYDRSIKVSQMTVDAMKKMGMKAALDKANSGTAGGEFVEAARRFYGNRVSPTVTKTAAQPKGPQGAVVGDNSPNHTPGPVVAERNRMAANPAPPKFGKNESAI